jgi:hypothetical protein
MDRYSTECSRTSERASTAPSGLSAVRPLRLGLIVAFAVQLWALYLYAPEGTDSLPIPHLDKVVHTAIFALPAALGVLARFPLWIIGAVLAAHAPMSEIAQHHWLRSRSGDPWDVVADGSGVVMGLLVGHLMLPRS